MSLLASIGRTAHRSSPLITLPSSRSSFGRLTTRPGVGRAVLPSSFRSPFSSASPQPPTPTPSPKQTPLIPASPSNDATPSLTPTTPPTPLHENIYTIPNALTVSRILACPILAYSIIHGDHVTATALLAYAGLTDWVDGFLARRYNMGSIAGMALDPLADKILMTTLTCSLTYGGLLPLPLAILILGRDVALTVAAFYLRYKTLAPPKTWSRYWDLASPSVEFHPNTIGKLNTLLQLVLMGSTTVAPLITGFDTSLILTGMQWTVGATTAASGLSYVFSKTAVKVIRQ